MRCIRMTYLTKENLIKLAQNKWRIDFPEMLLQNTDPEHPREYRGSGYVEQDVDGILRLHMFATYNHNISLFDPNEMRNCCKRIIPAEKLFNLTATDLTGQKWRAERIYPDCSYGYANYTSISSPINRISYCNEINESSPAGVFIFMPTFELSSNQRFTIETSIEDTNIESYSSRTASNFSFDGLDIHYHQNHGVIRIKIDAPPEEYLYDIDQLLLSTLRFITGELVYPLVSVKRLADRMQVEIHSKKPKVKNIQPPVPCNSSDDWNPILNTEGLFPRYFRLMKQYQTIKSNPIANNVYGLLETASATLEARCLSTVVAVESLLHESPYGEYANSSNEWIQEVEQLEIILENQTLSKRMQERLKGTFGMWKKENPTAILKQLAKDGIVRDCDVNAWKKVRNRAAHGTQLDNDPETLFNDYLHILVLFYHLIFHMIGYHGPYIDYVDINHAIETYQNTP